MITEAIEHYLKKYQLPLSELIAEANQMRIDQFSNQFELCSIANVKSGKCSEDCKFCSQSIHYDTGIDDYQKLETEKILALAYDMEARGVKRFSLVTSGKALTNSLLKHLLPIYKVIKSSTSLEICASHGIINRMQAELLKMNGVIRYHHNLEACRSFFPKICTTHTYNDRFATVKSAKSAGMEVCCGGIIGLGESVENRIELALEINSIGAESIPINILQPIQGTPLQNHAIISVEEILRTIAVFRLINPLSELRIAGGRKALKGYETLMMKSGINAFMVGNYLTTNGMDYEEDLKLINDHSLKLSVEY